MRDLYDTDFYSWTLRQAELIREGRLAELDLENILEEIESMGRSDYRALQSRLEVLFMHLLKWEYQPEKRQTRHSWERTIREQRKQTRRILQDSPSLKCKIEVMLPVAYKRAVEDAAEETGLSPSTFPKERPWSYEQAINPEFWP
ncbi:DUF29 domain-containing protein [Endozoicomonas numazuensis]|uniref:DUF29 domain-containing protein n=1 Tax=Endozoicomonas numazuensis TaxID=1137799 RepID=A0A081N3P9_9GAMM|nr:DUF29 domain-containing protein [Endozoicomonas numazuensis]KEQ13072.1 hypothetical protein GZ78_26300 [Endozoicomonas numazuensis]